MDEMEQFKQTFFQECEELLGDLEERLLALQEDGSDMESLHAAFRAIHSIKGGAGAFGFDRLVAFAHIFETALDLMRDGKLETNQENIELSVRAADVVADLVRAAETGTDLPEGYENEFLIALKKMTGGDAEEEQQELDEDAAFDAEIGFVPVAAEGVAEEVEKAREAGEAAETGASTAPVEEFIYHISFNPHTEMLRRANEPLLLIRELKNLGTVVVTPDLSRLPPFSDLRPGDAYLSWRIDLTSAAERATVDEVFEFVVDDCDLEITVDDAAVSTELPPVEEQPAPPAGLAAPPAAEPADADQVSAASEPKQEEPAPQAKKSAPSAVRSIRVDLSKMDRMVNMVGELVITQAMLEQQGKLVPQDQFPGLKRGMEELHQHTRELQDGVMAMRAQPVKSVFARMPRLVRELTAQTGKKVHLIMTGENTEIDKTVIEQLSDPLVHMIRNAVDHGIEKPEERIQAGKTAEGTIHLSAEHRGGRIVIEIRDDGRGIDRERVLKKAIEKGLVPPNKTLDENEINNLLFLPGFSTAESASNISGRGVGMDVVVRNIQSLGGRVMIQSSPGKGAVFSMSLPLTLAILDGMIVRTGNQSYVMPLSTIIESIRPSAEEIHTMADDSNSVVLFIRGEYIKLIFLHRAFGISGAEDDPSKALVVMVETEGGGKVGIVVDEIVGQQQVVIKSLEDNFEAVEGTAAATILGDGKVALILDVTGLEAISRRNRPYDADSGLPIDNHGADLQEQELSTA